MDYLSQTVLDIRPNFEAISQGELDDFVFDSVGHGKATPWKATDKLKRRVRLPFLFDGAVAIADFRQFVQDRDGRRQGFWLPLYLNDYRLTADASAGASTIAIEDCGLTARIAEGNQFKHLALVTKDTIECYGIASVAPSGGVETITLQTTLATALTAANTVCCPLLWVRFSDDEIEYQYENEDVAKADVAFTELPSETLAPDGSGTVSTGSRPIWLYKLTKDAVVYRYANYGVNILDANANTWSAADITHEEISSGIDLISEGVKVTIKTDDSAHPLRGFLDRLQQITATLEIFQTDADALAVDEAVPIHSGRIEEVSFRGSGEIELDVSSLFRIVEKRVPAMQFARICNHRPFDAGCGLVEATWTTAGTVTALSSSPAYVEAAAFATKVAAESDNDWFALGKVRIGSEVRLCTGVDGVNTNRLYLNAPFRSAAVTDAVSATAGDNKRIGTCQAKFNNVANFAGFPFMPNKNPQFKALETPKPEGGKK